MAIRIIPVIDLKQGEVVHARYADSRGYFPLVSCLTRSSNPLEVACAFATRLGLSEDLYLADIDAIRGAEPSWQVYADLRRLGFRLMVDAGISDLVRPKQLVAAGIENIIIGLETLPGPALLADILQDVPSDRAIFSLDLKSGQPMTQYGGWGNRNAVEIVGEVVRLGIRRIIVLDLARVGCGQGTQTETLCLELRQRYPETDIIAGGGVRDANDLARLEQAGVSAALIASALHDGRIRREHVKDKPQISADER